MAVGEVRLTIKTQLDAYLYLRLTERFCVSGCPICIGASVGIMLSSINAFSTGTHIQLDVGGWTSIRKISAMVISTNGTRNPMSHFPALLSSFFCRMSDPGLCKCIGNSQVRRRKYCLDRTFAQRREAVTEQWRQTRNKATSET
jgi:hypothetical protein